LLAIYNQIKEKQYHWLFFSLHLYFVTFLEIKPLSAEQLPAVVELDRICFGGHWTLEGYQRELESSSSHFLTLTLSPHLPISPSPSPPLLAGMGCFWSILEEAHITLLAIHPDYQRQGLGRSLLSALVQLARAQGLERATLEVRPSNQAALSLYQKFGFQEAGRRRRYYQDNDEDALILWRSGLQAPDFERSLPEVLSHK
jgi:[ribosomal protein S18]-alanine N-acetyltransferase